MVGMAVRSALLPVVFLVWLCRWAGWSDGGRLWRTASRREQGCSAGFPGPAGRELQDVFPGRGRDAGRNLNQFAADRAGARLAEGAAGEGASGAGEVEGAFHGSSPELRLHEQPLTDPVALQDHLTSIRGGLVADPAATISSCKSL